MDYNVQVDVESAVTDVGEPEMTELVIKYLLWGSAIGCGLLAGVYFAFSTFIMKALGGIEPMQGVSAMNAVNSTILHSLFMPFFFGTTMASAALAVTSLFHRAEPGSTAMLAGGLIYVAGMFLCTILFNVPLNNALAAIDRSGTAASLWARYLKEWTLWNHVRTISSTAACALYIIAIASK